MDSGRKVGDKKEKKKEGVACPLCGKKRHVKTSDCPNNKNKDKGK